MGRIYTSISIGKRLFPIVGQPKTLTAPHQKKKSIRIPAQSNKMPNKKYTATLENDPSIPSRHKKRKCSNRSEAKKA